MKVDDSEWYQCDALIQQGLKWLEEQCGTIHATLYGLGECVQDAAIAKQCEQFGERLIPMTQSIQRLNQHTQAYYHTYIQAIDTVDGVLH